MANDMKAAAGAAGTIFCGLGTAVGGVLTVATLGQAEWTKDMTKTYAEGMSSCASYTSKNAQQSIVGGVVETTADATALAGLAAAHTVTLGQIDAIDKAGARQTEALRSSAGRTLQRTGQFVDGATNAVPVVGHIKGKVREELGDAKGAKASYDAANRTLAVGAGGVAGFLASGPIGAGAAGVAAGAMFDGPNGPFIAGLQQVFNGEANVEVILENCFLVPVGDFMAGYAVGNAMESRLAQLNSKLKSKGVQAMKGRPVKGSLLEVKPRPGRAQLYAHNRSVNFNNNMKAIERIRGEMGPLGKQKTIHVAAGPHGSPNQGVEFGPLADSVDPTGSYACDAETFLAEWKSAQDRGLLPNVHVHDVTTPAGYDAFKAQLKTPGATCYIDWCYGVDNKWAL